MIEDLEKNGDEIELLQDSIKKKVLTNLKVALVT
jgi:hypothetical protein